MGDKLTSENPDYCCPISLMVFKSPVTASDGFTYDEASLKQLLANKQVSPMTRETLKSTYRPVPHKKAEVTVFLQQRSQELLDFALEAAEQKGLALAALERVAEYVEVLGESVTPGLQNKAVCTYQQLGTAVPAALGIAKPVSTAAPPPTMWQAFSSTFHR